MRQKGGRKYANEQDGNRHYKGEDSAKYRQHVELPACPSWGDCMVMVNGKYVAQHIKHKAVGRRCRLSSPLAWDKQAG